MILMVNCSYKTQDGNTQFFLEHLKAELSGEQLQILPLRQVLGGGFAEFVKQLEKAESFVIGAPLYVDGLPAQAVKLLEMLLEADHTALSGKGVYVVSNLGFYEGEQICNLFDIVRNWCARMGMVYGGGLAVGAGPMIRATSGLPLHRDIEKGLHLLADHIRRGTAMGNYYAKTLIPRGVYLQAAHMTFRKTLKKNGCTGSLHK